MKRILIGIDDTDNKESRGTGFRARQLGHLIEASDLGIVKSITRHQLLFDRRIPYTSQNSSACLEVIGNDIVALIELSRLFLLRESADGSDAGLAVKFADDICDEIVNWGLRAKKEILNKGDAYLIARANEVFLEGLTGTKDGIIGALAGIGLRKWGNDGRCIWIKGKELRDLSGIYLAEELFNIIGIDAIKDGIGAEVNLQDRIFVGDWVRPAVKDSNIIIFVEKALNQDSYEWTVATKDRIKSITD